ncbi:hypothetical protein [Rhizobium sp. IMFF44]|uniref:hypothetical protein n=1 Tax=Rhizobium sp. IMFF44 TaxID=3342350 RepID=UPI0035BA8A89
MHCFRWCFIEVVAALFLRGAGCSDRRAQVGARGGKPGGKPRLYCLFDQTGRTPFGCRKLARLMKFLAGKAGILGG